MGSKYMPKSQFKSPKSASLSLATLTFISNKGMQTTLSDMSSCIKDEMGSDMADKVRLTNSPTQAECLNFFAKHDQAVLKLSAQAAAKEQRRYLDMVLQIRQQIEAMKKASEMNE